MDRATLDRALVSALLGLPAPVMRALSGGRRLPVDGNDLDPQAQLLVFLSDNLGPPRSWRLPIAEARGYFDQGASSVDHALRWSLGLEDRLIPGPAGAIPIRIYRPAGLPRRAPALVYYHGGGWVLGGIRSHDAACRALAEEAGVAVVSVDYRLAPEHRYPAAADDALAAFLWVAREAEALGLDPARLAVGGDSAGGNLAAVVSQDLRQGALGAGGPAPALQLLIYPATDMTRSLASHRKFASGYLLDDASMTWFLDAYAPDVARRLEPRASPLFADELAGLPPAIVLTAGYDPLRDEGRAYADRLEQAGVSVRYRCLEGMVHGFWSMAGVVAAAREAFGEAARLLRDGLASRPGGAT
jgi:acetyl esterase